MHCDFQTLPRKNALLLNGNRLWELALFLFWTAFGLEKVKEKVKQPEILGAFGNRRCHLG